MLNLKRIIKECLNEELLPNRLSKLDMIKLGATGSLNSAYERYVPINKIKGLDPSPADWVDDMGNVRDFIPNTSITSSIEVVYDSNEDVYYLYNGNHRLKQAMINGDKYIRAFVEPDNGKIGDDVKLKK